jgi:hypothetical protein
MGVLHAQINSTWLARCWARALGAFDARRGFFLKYTGELCIIVLRHHLLVEKWKYEQSKQQLRNILSGLREFLLRENANWKQRIRVT